VGQSLGFGDVPNEVTILDASGDVVSTSAGSKLVVAHAILDQVAIRQPR